MVLVYVLEKKRLYLFENRKSEQLEVWQAQQKNEKMCLHL